VVKWGQVKVKTLVFDVPSQMSGGACTVTLNGGTLPSSHEYSGNTVTVTLASDAVVNAGSTLLFSVAGNATLVTEKHGHGRLARIHVTRSRVRINWRTTGGHTKLRVALYAPDGRQVRGSVFSLAGNAAGVAEIPLGRSLRPGAYLLWVRSDDRSAATRRLLRL
jgi:hypothetical protein